MRESFSASSLLILAAFLVVSLCWIPAVNGFVESAPLQTGPYVDEVIFKVIPYDSERLLALQAGEIELDTSLSWYYLMLDEDPDIDTYTTPRNSYTNLIINCAKYPLNISGFRRAFAFAYNKTRVLDEWAHGPGIEHDSLLPRPNAFCIEDQFDWHYYSFLPEIGNQILDDLNFTIDTETGYRVAPDGSPFSVTIEYTACSCEKSGGHAKIGVDALHSLGINASMKVANFEEYIPRLDHHGDYDMIIRGRGFDENDVQWLGYEFGSEFSDEPYLNPSNFANDSYDIWLEQLLHGTSYEAVCEAATEMQKILHYNVPELVLFERTDTQVYRTDVFTGHIEDISNNISGPWTVRKIHRLDGTFGGTVTIAISMDPDSFNFYMTSSDSSKVILEELWPSLYDYGPDMNPIPDLVENMLIETHSDNHVVPDGHTRFTLDILQNATWSDGAPLTAEDVVFTFVYAIESGSFGNPIESSFSDLSAVYAPTPYRVVLEFSTESYWNFNDFAFEYIIPIHIFNNTGGIGYEGWNIWNPIFESEDPHVTCGPFVFSDFEEGNYYKIERNPLFHYAASYENTTTTTSLNPTTSNTNQTTLPQIPFSLTIASAVGGFSSIIILYCGVQILQKRRSLTNT
ncbi:hypothetical protein EU528_01430 [Candidatus Thorarchaeota archaeon]|nr:MAG: hypothetical protein EU528_01430 [Candidatus Thorarchaeota archaeon]